jgi:hypothetical protein
MDAMPGGFPRGCPASLFLFPGAGIRDVTAGAAPPRCSARDCDQPAGWILAWNNPKIHGPERRKTWTACSQHREHLAGFLEVRGFLREVMPLDEWLSRPDRSHT